MSKPEDAIRLGAEERDEGTSIRACHCRRAAASIGLHSQQQQPSAPAGALPSPPAREPAWAFPVQAGSLPAESPGTEISRGKREEVHAEGDSTTSSIRRTGCPRRITPAPSIVVKGHGGALACGSCHLMSGLGHPESADLTGFTADYIVQQMADFKSGTRKDYALDERHLQGSLGRGGTAGRGLVRLPASEGSSSGWWKPRWCRRRSLARDACASSIRKDKGMEPIGNRIITLPEDQERARLRDPRSGFVAYVPPGSLAKGKALVGDRRRQQDHRVRCLPRRWAEGARERSPRSPVCTRSTSRVSCISSKMAPEPDRTRR